MVRLVLFFSNAGVRRLVCETLLAGADGYILLGYRQLQMHVG
jgi:hypothetical protein